MTLQVHPRSLILGICSIPNPYSGQNFGMFPWSRSMMLGSAK